MAHLQKKLSEKEVEQLLKDYNVLKARYAALEEEESKRKTAEERLFFLHELMNEVIEADTFETAIKITLEKICKKTEWVFAQTWYPGGNDLQLGEEWYSQENKLNELRDESIKKEKIIYPGFLRKVLNTKNSVWIQDISREEDFPRVEIAKKLGVKASLAVPIVYKNRLITILEFFMFENKPKDIGLMGLVLAVSVQLGGIFELKKSQSNK